MATKKPKDAAAAAGPANRGLRVITKRDGFRRAGLEWTGVTTKALSELTDEQVDLIKTEPMFVVDEVDIEAPAET